MEHIAMIKPVMIKAKALSSRPIKSQMLYRLSYEVTLKFQRVAVCIVYPLFHCKGNVP